MRERKEAECVRLFRRVRAGCLSIADTCYMKYSSFIRVACRETLWSAGQRLSALVWAPLQTLSHTRGLWQPLMRRRAMSAAAGGCTDREARGLLLSAVKHQPGQTQRQQITLYHFIKSCLSCVCHWLLKAPRSPESTGPPSKQELQHATKRICMQRKHYRIYQKVTKIKTKQITRAIFNFWFTNEEPGFKVRVISF